MFIYIFSIARERYFGGTVFFFVLSTMRLEFFKNLCVFQGDRFVFVLCFDHERFPCPCICKYEHEMFEK